jgi:hypothetical protein
MQHPLCAVFFLGGGCEQKLRQIVYHVQKLKFICFNRLNFDIFSFFADLFVPKP